MKSLFKKIALFFNYLFNFRTIKRFQKINNKLEQTLENREVDRIILKGNIIKMVRKYLRVDAKSKYIPKDRKNHAQIKSEVLHKFGTEMEKLGISINDKLELV